MSSLVPDLDSSSDSCTYNDKPPIEELRQFLEFQLPRQRALVFSGLPLGPQRRQLSSASLQFSFMGPKLCVNTTQVVMRLRGHRDYAFASGWHPGGHIFATGNEDKTCRVWVAVRG
ncbi:hypothetical protein L6164_016021 [Bauhinia variegata]|uniref:Uncharacterized protein n=1 Tax=Bauhinia variegata TaxID=167791 RepID=A0ACB9NM47_BAUVA|nr:hypothetical protein L6164_016021 [Bauhinia variegata]